MTSLAVQKGPDSAVGGGKQPLAPPVSPSPRRLPHPRPSPRPSTAPPPTFPTPSTGRPGEGLPPVLAGGVGWGVPGLTHTCFPGLLEACCGGKPPSGSEWECPEDTSLPSDRVSVPALLPPAGGFWGAFRKLARVHCCTPFCEVLGGSSSQYCTFTVCGRQRSASWIL